MVVLLALTALLALITPLQAAGSPPGTLITIQATCSVSTEAFSQAASTASYLVVRSPLVAIYRNPVYLAKGWDPLANGMLVRFLHADNRGHLEILQGIQLIDSRVLVNGVPVERNVDVVATYVR